MPIFKNFGAFTLAAVSQLIALLGSIVTTLNQTVGTIPANVLTGALSIFCISSNATPGNQTTRTAAQLFADLSAQWGIPLTDPSLSGGISYDLTIANTGAGTLTLVGGAGVTITGATATVPTNTTKTWLVVLLPTTATFTEVSVGTYA
jgi:hypothetical protein